MKHIVKHFQTVDPILASALVTLEPLIQSRDYFSDLCEIIIQQQLSEKAGETLWKRFKEKIGRPTPKKIMRTPAATIRSAGISWGKVSYLKNLALFALKENLQNFAQMKDSDVIEKLTQVKGIGPWSAEMFLMFSLAREDVFSYGDLGLRTAIKRLYHIQGEPTRKQMETIVNRWVPYRTYAARILWQSLVK